MKTDTLIDLLARGAGPAPRALAARRLSPAALVGLLVSAGAAIYWFGAIPAGMFATAVSWTKMLYAGALALAAAWLTARLSRPAASVMWPRRGLLAVLITMALVGATSLISEPSGARMQALLGSSWSTCPWSVLLLSLPALAASLWAVRSLAPTRPRSAGFAAGPKTGARARWGKAWRLMDHSTCATDASPAAVSTGACGCVPTVRRFPGQSARTPCWPPTAARVACPWP